MRSLAAAVLVVLALVGCSPDEEENRDTEPPAGVPEPESETTAADDDEAALREAVQAYSDAYLTGDADAAFALLTSQCRETVGRETFAGVVEQAAEAYGSALPFATFEAEVDGEEAVVTYTYDVAAIDQDAEPWVQQDGVWLNADC